MKSPRLRLLLLMLFAIVGFGMQSAEAACNAGYLYNVANCPTLQFFDQSTSTSGTVTQWSWTFGDGGTSTAQNPQHTYTANGTYTVCLVITTQFGCGSQYCGTIFISCIQPSQCQANYSVNLAGCPQIQFTSTSVVSGGTITSYNWNFGDGGTSTTQNPTHTYLTNGNYVVCLTIGTSTGCQSTFCDTVAITCNASPCNANWQPNFANCPTISFTNASTTTSGVITGYSWNFGDGGSSSVSNPSHTYTANGTYTVCHRILTNTGCMDTLCMPVTITCVQPQQCQANFNVNLAGCPQILFTSTSTASSGTITSYSWNFGDGGTSTAQNPAHTYLTNGNYIVCLTIGTSTGCQSSFCDTVSITCNASSCNADWQPNFANCPSISFTNASTTTSGVITGYSWNFGDGGTSTVSNPNHTYTANGTYNVCLYITTNTGCTDSMCMPITITCVQPQQCQANFNVNLAGCPQILFTSTSTVSSGTIVSYNWNFGDGGTSTAQNPAHTYLTNGNYVVCLFIVTSTGCQSSYCDTVSITCNAGGCNADWQPNFANCPSISFTNGSTTSSGVITGYSWDFGDGGTSTVSNPSHTYTANGTYNVCLYITTNTGCTDSMCMPIAITCINPPCMAGWQANLSGCPQILFTDLSVPGGGSITSWNWTFGDGGTATTQHPAHIYIADGTYPVCLTIGTDQGCQATYCDTLVIACNQSCNAAFQATSNPNLVTSFTDLSTITSGIIAQWSWTFGDGGTSNAPQPVHPYSQPGNYVVCLTIITDWGCIDSTCDTITVGTVGVEPGSSLTHFSLGPNPFAEGLTVEYGLLTRQPVTVALLDMQGRVVAWMDEGMQSPGNHVLRWNGEGLAAGPYLLRFQTGKSVICRTVVRQ